MQAESSNSFILNFEMNKFVLKIFIFGISLFAIITLAVFFKIYQSGRFNFKLIPKNNLSNNVCFRAKMDHLAGSDNFKNCSVLIVGSSMSLANMSGQTIENESGQCTYNIAAWGIGIDQTCSLVDIINKERIKYIILAFNNCDFSNTPPVIDFKSTALFINKGPWIRAWLFLKEMSLPTLFSDISFRKDYLNISNNHYSLNFDKTGSIQSEHAGF